MSVVSVNSPDHQVVQLGATYSHELIAQQPELSLCRQIRILEFDLGQAVSHRFQGIDCDIALL